MARAVLEFRLDRLRHADKQIMGIGGAVGAQESFRPALHARMRRGRRHDRWMIGVAGKGKHAGMFGDIVRGEVHRGMVEADRALEAQLGSPVVEFGGGDVVAEIVAGPVQPARRGLNGNVGIKDDLVAVVARPQHHAMFAKGHRLTVAISGDVFNDENRHAAPNRLDLL